MGNLKKYPFPNKIYVVICDLVTNKHPLKLYERIWIYVGLNISLQDAKVPSSKKNLKSHQNIIIL